ncbi:MAG: apolipoprotein N-acyltransferase [Pseudomonadota bacterium]
MKRLKLRRILGDSLALLAGGCLPLSFAPYGLFPVAVLSPALLFCLWQNISPRRAFWRGLLYGVGMFGIGVSWVHISFHQFGGMPLLGSILLTATFVLGMALYPALLGGLLTRFFPNNTPTKLLLILPAAWTLIEWLRGWLFTGFPWLSIGYSQIDSPLNGFAPLLGVYGVSWITIFTAALLVKLTTILNPNAISCRQGDVAKTPQLSRYLKFISVLFLIWGGGWLLNGVSWTTTVGKPLQIAMVQGNVPQEFKWLSSYQISTIQRYLELSQVEADIIIWPESAIPLFFHEIPKYMPDFFKKLEEQHLTDDTDFLIGIPVMRRDGSYLNSVASIGTQPGFYNKHHLVPFGEYIPFQSFLGNLLKLLEVPMSEFSAGAAQQANLYSAGQAIGVSICYEDAFGELIRNSLPSARLLVNVSNDAWFGDSIAPHQHLEIARMRALESGRYLLRATNTGISAVINAKGEVVMQAAQFEILTLIATAQAYQGATLYVRFGNGLVVTLLLVSLLLGGARYALLS